MVNITSQNLTELIRNIKEKKISSEEITKSFIERSKKSKIFSLKKNQKHVFSVLGGLQKDRKTQKTTCFDNEL